MRIDKTLWTKHEVVAMVEPSGPYGCAIVMSYMWINIAVSQWLSVFLDLYSVHYFRLTFNLCISNVWQAHPTVDTQIITLWIHYTRGVHVVYSILGQCRNTSALTLCDDVVSLLVKGCPAFTGKLLCHWLNGFRQQHAVVVGQGLINSASIQLDKEWVLTVEIEVLTSSVLNTRERSFMSRNSRMRLYLHVFSPSPTTSGTAWTPPFSTTSSSVTISGVSERLVRSWRSNSALVTVSNRASSIKLRRRQDVPCWKRNNKACHPGCLMSCCYFFLSSHCNSFDDQAPIDLICECPSSNKFPRLHIWEGTRIVAHAMAPGGIFHKIHQEMVVAFW